MRSLPSGRRTMRALCQMPYTMASSAQASAKLSPPVIYCSPCFFSLKRARILSGQRCEGACPDGFHRAEPGDFAVPGRARVARSSPLAVVVDERARLRAINLEPLALGFFAIVFPLDERLAGHVVAVRDARRMEAHVVAA